MTRTLVLLAIGFTLTGTAASTAWGQEIPPPPKAVAALPAPARTLQAMEAVADWQLPEVRAMPEDALRQWTQGTLFTGLMALAAVSPNPTYMEAVRTIAERARWQLGRHPAHADDQCVAQLYLDLLHRWPDSDRLSQVRQQLDAARLASTTESWSWCDALFMAPPVWARLYRATGDAGYLEFLDRLWTHTTDTLYDPAERLYARDRSKIARREANGAKVFWCRGNGWVLGALARTIPLLPAEHPRRATLLAQFRAMAARLAELQQADGMWHASLLDPTSFPLPESSGTGLITFALAWGIRQEVLDRTTYLPVVARAWSGLLGCIGPDGRLHHVQPVGGGPAPFSPDDTQTYGVGAFLLAGSEILPLAAGQGTP